MQRRSKVLPTFFGLYSRPKNVLAISTLLRLRILLEKNRPAARSRFVQIDKLRVDFSSSSFVIRFNLHLYPLSFLFGVF